MNTDLEIDLGKYSATELLDKEWLITNGLGGYASGTLLGDLARRYHGLFLPNLTNPKGRHLMISRVCEEITAGEQVARFGYCNLPPKKSAIEPMPWLKSFRLQANTAHWQYAIGDTVIEKSVLMPHLQNSVCVRYALLSGTAATLKLRPYFPFRRQDAPLNKAGYANFVLSIREDRHEISLESTPLVLRLAMRPGPIRFVLHPDSIDQELHRERRRGHEYEEHARSLGYFQTELLPGEPIAFVATTHNSERLDFDIPAAFTAEPRRIAAVVGDAFADDTFGSALAYATDQFLVLPASRIEDSILAQARGHELRTVIAGYHWFGDWGRDTMISLEGLMLCTGRRREARATLQTFASYVADGLLPNLFPEGERLGLYHTVDATLWYFHALHRYLKTTGDASLLAELLPTLQSIVDHHVVGTKFGIHMNEADGLISAGANGYQLTWMDAKVDGWVVTPRRGKPVEIQALWYNALRLMSTWTQDEALRATYERIAGKAKQTFNRRFWNESRQCLLDVIDGPTGDDPSVRPNQMFSISLDHPILDRDRWSAVVATLQAELLTPYGLRTLSKDHPDYKHTYHGDLRSRDAAYHQGTVWPWLIGHFIDAWIKVGRPRSDAHALLGSFKHHLSDGGIGTISEIFDAEQPHAPHGCIAQAWSVAEVLRAWMATK